MLVHLIRHGQTNWNEEHRAQGHSESALTSLGKQQAAALGADLSQRNINKVYCSSSVRTRETADQLFIDSTPEIHYLDSLKEIHLGSWEGRLYSDIKIDSPEDFHHFWHQPHLFSVAGAESFYELQKRALQALFKICKKTQDTEIAIISHGALIKSLLCHYEDRPLSGLWDPPKMHNCAHSILELDSNARGYIIQYAGMTMDVT